MNHNQNKRYAKIYNDPLFLIPPIDSSDDDRRFVFKIVGSTRNVYTVIIDRHKRNITCDCPDNHSWAKKLGCICKHCCFVLFKVLGRSPFTDVCWDSLTVYEEVMTKIAKTIANRIESRYESMHLTQRYNAIINGDDNTTTTITEFTCDDANVDVIDEDDNCPICFDILSTGLVKCPQCRNVIHDICMKKWLENTPTPTCIFCRSQVWKRYLATAPPPAALSSKYTNLG